MPSDPRREASAPRRSRADHLFCAGETTSSAGWDRRQIGGSARVLLDLPVTTRDLSPRSLHAVHSERVT